MGAGHSQAAPSRTWSFGTASRPQDPRPRRHRHSHQELHVRRRRVVNAHKAWKSARSTTPSPSPRMRRSVGTKLESAQSPSPAGFVRKQEQGAAVAAPCLGSGQQLTGAPARHQLRSRRRSSVVLGGKVEVHCKDLFEEGPLAALLLSAIPAPQLWGRRTPGTGMEPESGSRACPPCWWTWHRRATSVGGSQPAFLNSVFLQDSRIGRTTTVFSHCRVAGEHSASVT